MEEQKEQAKSEEGMREVEILEFSLTGEEINTLVEKLNALKQTKANISFEIDDSNEMLIHYEHGDTLEETSTTQANGQQTSAQAAQAQTQQPAQSSEVPTEVPKLP